MNEKRSHHLDEGQMARAVVDSGDLAPRAREHLARCKECREAVSRLELDLESLGRLARQCSPTSAGRIVFPEEGVHRQRAPGWGLALGSVAILCLAAVVFVWSLRLGRTPENGLASLTEEMQEDAALLEEIRSLEENPLPRSLLSIAVESSYGLEKDFIEFVVPITEDETMSDGKGKRGEWLC